MNALPHYKTTHGIASIAAALFAFAVADTSLGAADNRPPLAPCGQIETYPAYPATVSTPNVALWTGKDLGANWTPPECSGWAKSDATLAVALAGRIDQKAEVDQLLERMGALSAFKAIRYWSVNDRKWNALFPKASALKSSDPKSARDNFLAADFQSNHDLYFLTADNRSGADMVDRLRLLARDENHLRLETENVTPMRFLFVTVAAPGDIQTFYDLRRADDGTWRFYSLTRISGVPSVVSYVVRGESYVNRAAAMFRYMAGIPTDMEPPAAP